jgi:phosphoglycolate phosphatase
VVTKAIIFDLDGTLVEFKLDYKTERVEVSAWLAEQGIPVAILSMEKGLFGALRRMESYMKNIGKDETEIRRVKEGVLSMADRYEMKAIRETDLIPGVFGALRKLREMKLKIALFTIDGEKATSYALERFRIRRFFDAIATRDSVPAVKPDPAHLKPVLQALSIKPAEAIVVGDSVLDMRCAARLKVPAVGVVTGISTSKELIAAGASYLASSAAEVPSLVRQLGRKT